MMHQQKIDELLDISSQHQLSVVNHSLSLGFYSCHVSVITQYIPSDKDVQRFVFLGYDYKQKKPRPRPGLKKKILPSLNAEIYTLTCRYIECKVRYVTMRLSVKREVRALSTRLHFMCRPEMKEMTRCTRQNIS